MKDANCFSNAALMTSSFLSWSVSQPPSNSFFHSSGSRMRIAAPGG